MKKGKAEKLTAVVLRKKKKMKIDKSLNSTPFQPFQALFGSPPFFKQTNKHTNKLVTTRDIKRLIFFFKVRLCSLSREEISL